MHQDRIVHMEIKRGERDQFFHSNRIRIIDTITTTTLPKHIKGINTFAGTGTQGFASNGVQATSTSLYSPHYYDLSL